MRDNSLGQFWRGLRTKLEARGGGATVLDTLQSAPEQGLLRVTQLARSHSAEAAEAPAYR